MPLLVPERHLMRINSMDTLLGSISMIAAPALGILLFAAFGLQASIALGGLGATCAVATMFLAKLPKVVAEENVGPWQSMKEGVLAFISGLIPSNGYWVFAAVIGTLAIACAWFNAPLMTLLQTNIAEDKLGRVMGLFTALNGLAIPAGTAVGGIIAEATGTPLFFAIDGAFTLVLAVVIAVPKSVRALN